MKEQFVNIIETSVTKLPAIKGRVIDVRNWTGSTLAVTTDYGLYAVHRDQNGVTVQLIAAFIGE